MVVKCDIEFEQNEMGCYFAGQLISGTIVLKCDKVKDVKAIQLQISGFAQVLWSETKKLNSHRNFEAHEDYLSSTTYLMGSEDSSRNTIAVGIQTYTFACQLPQNCPSSFEGTHGHIRYTVKVALLRPWKFDQIYMRAFTVLKITDLNFESPQIRIPSNSEAYRVFCCGPCTTRPLKMELKIPQAGYVPGQIIPVQALITNNSNIAIAEIQFALIMIVRYISKKPTCQNVQRISVSKVGSGEIAKNSTKVLKDAIYIPATPPTCLHTCGIIQIVYHVEMEVKMKSFHKSQLITIPVIIGNIPLVNNTSGMEVIQEEPRSINYAYRERPVDLPFQFEENLSSGPTFDMLGANSPPNLYEESYHMARNNIVDGEEHVYGPCEFTPVYPVYKLPSPTFKQHNNKTFGIDNNSFVP